MGALDELLASWRSSPDADSTIALCAYLGATGQEALVREVGSTAETWHARDTTVMLSVGRMYLDAGLLPEAQSALVVAGKADPSSAKPFRFLGEVLLRRGDAARAEKVLARAIQLGQDDSDTRHWHDRASFYIALQKRVGPQMVANEVAKALPRAPSIPPPVLKPRPLSSEELTNPRGDEAPLPRFDSVEEVSQVEELGAPTPAVRTRGARAPTMLGVAPPPSLGSAPQRVVVPARNQAQRPVMPSHKATIPSPPPPSPQSFTDLDAELIDDEASGLEDPTHARAANPFEAPTRPAASGSLSAVAGGGWSQHAVPAVTGPLPPPSVPPSTARPRSALSARPPYTNGSARPPAFGEPGAGSLAPPPRYDGPAPPPSVVFEHLARVGVFEPSGGAAPAWERPPRQKSRSPWVFVVASVLLLAAGFGGWEYAKRLKAEKAAAAVALANEVEQLLHTGGVAELKATDEKLSKAFELDSLSQRAARLWLENRVLGALMLSGEARGIDSAIHRGRTVGLADKDLAFGRMASFLVEGDLAGAAAQLPKWDKESGRDAYYQLAAGAVLERAGDLRAIERYEAARALDPKLALASLLLARLALLELGGERAGPLLADIKEKLGDRPSARAIRALAWVVDHDRPEQPPADARLTPEEADQLPAPLAAIPFMSEAARAVRSGDREKLEAALGSAIRLADTPSLASGLGFLAIEAGDEQLARKAALKAVSFSAMYPRARTLAARVALLGGRVDEAQKAVEQLDSASPDVAVVRAVAAYESLEPGDLETALKALGDAAQSSTFAALAAGSGVLSGLEYPAPAARESFRDPSVPWGELVATDAALDQNDLTAAEAILGVRSGDALRPVHLLRLARLRRYQGKAAEAVAASGAALEGGVTVPLLIERTYDLVLHEDIEGARSMLAKYPVLLGPMGGWLSTFVDGHGKDNADKASAAARAAKLELPPEGSALTIRLLALRALIAAGDKRARDLIRRVGRTAPKHPEFLIAASEL